jgi:two-component system sensor histidine kinase HydH
MVCEAHAKARKPVFQSSDYHQAVVSSRGHRPSFFRLVRWAAAGLLIALGLTLSVTSFSGYRVVRGVLDTVVQGQGEALVQSVLRATQRGARVDEDTLKGVLESESPLGLRCLVLFDYVQEGASGQQIMVRPRVAVGTCLSPASAWGELVLHKRNEAPQPVGDRLRLLSGPPPSPKGQSLPGILPSYGGPPPAGAPWPEPTVDPPASTGPAFPGPQPLDGAAPRIDAPSAGPRGARPMLLEFVPQMAEALRFSATRTLLSGGIATLALVLAGAVFFGLSLRQERAQATQEQKRQLASLGEMASVLAHELRNPLAALKGHAQLLQELLPEGSRPRDKAARVVSEAERLEVLSEDLLSFVRTTAIDPQRYGPAAFLTECVDEISDPRIELHTSQAPPAWRFDPQRMRQVMSNLLRNALEASPADKKVQVSAYTVGKELVFTVRDHGKGIREQDLERIFQPFFTTRARGTGLGLAIVRRLVQLHGGSVTAKNAPDGGAIFTVRLPKDPP